MKQQSATVTGIEWLTPTIISIQLTRNNGQPFFSFQPGQYASLNFPDFHQLHGFRAFSIASSPVTPQVLEFGIRVHGPYTRILKKLQPGDRANVQGAFGKFTTHGVRQRPIVLLAGGIGVTPFMSMIRTAAALQLPTPITLLFANRSFVEIPYYQELRQLEQRASSLRTHFFLSDEAVEHSDQITSGRITGDAMVDKVGESFWGSIFFLCGPAPFMNAMEQTLVSMGIDKKNIRSESFSVKPGALFEPNSPWPKLVLAGWGSAAGVALGVIYAQAEKPESTSTTTAPVNTTINTTLPIPTTPTNTVTPAPIPTAPISPPVNTTAIPPTNTPTKPVTVTPKPTPKPVPQPVAQPRAAQS